MGLTFTSTTQSALFDPGYPILQNDRIDFSFGFWITFSSLTTSSPIFTNENYNTYQFIKVFIHIYL